MITGATSGIGKATAKKLAGKYNLIITGRRKDMLLDVVSEIQDIENTEILALNFDVCKNNEVEDAINSLEENWRNIDVLVNNAGLAVGMETIQEGVLDDWERMIDTNLKGLLYVSRAVSPIMVKRKTGHIINIGSIAGKEVYLKGNVYCASKHAVSAISKGMRIDMLPYGIKVSLVSPGMVETEFSVVRFKGNKDAANKVYEGLTPLFADDIAEAVLFVVTRPAHVNIDDLLIMPTAQATATQTHRV